MKRTEIKQILSNPAIGSLVVVKGWVRTFRNDQFIALNDGSTINNLQVVVNTTDFNEDDLKRLYTGTCISIEGTIAESLGKGQNVEIIATGLEILGDCDPNDFPIGVFARKSPFAF
jgi:asparaginyl-tRNA synthetase